MNFSPMSFLVNMKYMAVGMLTIVAVIGCIILMTAILNKIYKD